MMEGQIEGLSAFWREAGQWHISLDTLHWILADVLHEAEAGIVLHLDGQRVTVYAKTEPEPASLLEQVSALLEQILPEAALPAVSGNAFVAPLPELPQAPSEPLLASDDTEEEEARRYGIETVLAIQAQVNAAAGDGPKISLINAEELARIEELIAADTWPNKWDGTEATGDVLLPGMTMQSSLPMEVFTA